MTLNHVKLGRAVNFIKYSASVVSLTFLPETLIWNKTMFPASNLLNLAGLMLNAPGNFKNLYQYSFFYSIYHYLMQKFQELITKELENFTKTLIRVVFDES